MKLEKTKNAKKNIIWGILAKTIALLLPFATRSALIYKLGGEYLGLNSLFTAVLSVLSIAELGFSEAVVYHMYKPIADNDSSKICAILNMFRKVYFIVGGVVLAAGLATMPFLRFLIKGDVPADINLYVLYAIFLLNSSISYFGLSYRQSVFIANQRNDIIHKIVSIANCCQYGLQFILLMTVPNYYLYIVWLPVFTILSFVVQFLVAKKMYPQYYPDGSLSPEEKKEIRKSVSGIVFHKLGGVLSNSADSIIISAFLGLTTLAIYSNYFFVVTVLSGFYAIITDAILGGVGNSIATDSVDKNHQDLLKFSFLGCWLVGIATVCCVCIYQPFMYIWVGEGLMFNTSVMLVFCLYFFFMRFDNIAGVYKSAAGLWTQDKWRPLVSGITNLALNIGVMLALANYDQEIAVIGALVSSIFCKIFIDFLWGTRVLFKYYFERRETYYILELAYCLVATVAASAACYFICNLLPLGDNKGVGLALIVARGAICVALTSALFFLLFFKTRPYKDAKEWLLQKLRRK